MTALHRLGVARLRVIAVVLTVVTVSGCTSDLTGKETSRPVRPSSVAAPPSWSTAHPKTAHTEAKTPRAFTALEHRFHATLGVYVLDTESHKTLAFRADTRFAFASTSKFLDAAVLLRTATTGELNRVLRYRRSDLLAYSVITSKHLATGISVLDAMAAAMEYSDNTAANLMLYEIGGPQRLQRNLQTVGDEVTHVDRSEPALNDVTPGDLRDTSTPRALGADLERFLFTPALGTQKRALLKNWLIYNTTGSRYIRAGLPDGWIVGDRTGNAEYGTRNDIAVTWPPGRDPIIIVVESHRSDKNATSQDSLIADATEIAVQEFVDYKNVVPIAHWNVPLALDGS